MGNLSFQPSFAVSGKRVLFGLYPQAVESALKQGAQNDSDSLIDQALIDKMSKSFAGAANTKLVGFGYVDTPTQFSTAYTYLQFGLGFTGPIMDQLSLPPKSRSALKQLTSGFHLPPARTIYKHSGSVLFDGQKNRGGN